MIRRVIRDGRDVGVTITPDRIAFAVHAAGWGKGRRDRSGLGETPTDLVRTIREFARNMDPADHPYALAEVIAQHGYRHVRNPVHTTTRHHLTASTRDMQYGVPAN